MRSAASNCLPRGLPVVLDREELAEVVVDLGGVRLVAEALLELDLRGVESPDDHQIAAEDLVSLGVSDIELERLRQRVDRVADLLLGKETVAERVPAPGRLRTLLHVLAEQGLDFLELAVSNIAFELRHACGVVLSGVPLLFFDHREIPLRVGRVGTQLDRMPELGGRLLQVAFLECGAAFGDVQVRVLVAIVGGDKIAALLEFSCGFIRASRARQSQTQLVVSSPRSVAPAAPPPAVP